MSTKKLLSKANSLSNSLDELEAKLEPILSHPLQENLDSLEKLQQAKLNVLLPYLINDLIFIYLKTRGVDPKTHPVVAELDRVRQYFSKIKDAEDVEKKRPSGIDKAAAGRFIKHAIAQAKQNINTNNNSKEAGPSYEPSVYVPARVTEKMKEREAYLQNLKDDSESEEQALEVIGEDSNIGGDVEKKDDNAEQRGKKRRRRAMDPFGPSGDKGMDIDSATGTPKRSRKLMEVMVEETGTSSRASSVSNIDDASSITDKKRKKKKKSKKSQA